MNGRLRIFTWHVHGSYLFYLAQGNYDLYIPVNDKKSNGYSGRGKTFPFGPNVIEIPVEEVKEKEFDLILFQEDDNYLSQQFEILSDKQRVLPKIYLEHDPPWQDSTNELHIVDDNEVLLVHVTHFNRLMWNNRNLKVQVIEHGVMPTTSQYSGSLERGIVVINNLPQRGRLLGFDIFEEIRSEIPLDLIGMGTEEYGIGEVLHPDLPEFISRYRFFFNPIRYTSMGLAVCEAMMIGMPVVGLATTEMPTVFENGVSAFIHTDLKYLKQKMQLLLADHHLSRRIGEQGKAVAEAKFNIKRFTEQWEQTFQSCIAEGKSLDRSKKITA